MIAQQQRDARGRFVAGNTIASAGGHARAKKLSKRRRRAIARKGYRTMVARHFSGDVQAQKRYFGELGIWNSEKVFENTPIPVRASHPGPIQEWLTHYWQLKLLGGSHIDIQFMETAL